MKCERFAEIIEQGKRRWPKRPAVIYTEPGGEQKKISYSRLEELVFSRCEALKQDPSVCVGMYGTSSLSWIVDFFAAAMASKRVVLLDSSQSDEVTQALIEEYAVEKILPENPGLQLSEKREPGYEGYVLVFTSGTTAANKAVVLSQRALSYSAWNGQAMLPCREEDVIVGMLPMNHVFGLVCTLLWPLSNGACAAIGRGMRYYGEDAEAYGATILVCVPTLLNYLCAVKGIAGSVHTVLVGAAPCSEQLLNEVRAMGRRISFGYGLSETASGLAISVGSDDPFAMDLCPDTRITISEEGEVLVQTPCMMEGYWKRPEETAQVLSDGMLHTGDLGYLDEEGRLHLTGRKNDVLVLASGVKICTPEWEARLSKTLGPEIALGVSEGKLTLFAGDNADRELVLKTVDEFNETQPIPNRIGKVIITGNKLPRTATGKIRRWKLEEYK